MNDEQKWGRMGCSTNFLLLHTHLHNNRSEHKLASFRNWCAKSHHHPRHISGAPPPFSPPICICRCSSNRMMQHKGSRLELSTHNLWQGYRVLVWWIKSRRVLVQHMIIEHQSWGWLIISKQTVKCLQTKITFPITHLEESHSKGFAHRCAEHQDQ